MVSNNLSHDNLQSGIGLNTDSPSEISQRVIITGNICRANKFDGMDINVPRKQVRLTISNNVCSMNVRAGIYLCGVIGASITGNVCDLNGNAGIHVNGSRSMVISSNYVLSNNSSADSADSELDRSGITLQNSSYCSLVGNLSGNDGGEATQKYGIFMVDGSACVNRT